MAFSKNLASYNDIARVLTAAQAAGGGRITLGDRGKATRWRHRAYYYRKLLRDLSASGLTPFDDMTLSLEGNAVLIEFSRVEGTLTTLDGQPLDLPEAPSIPLSDAEEDALFEEARRFALNLGDEDE